MGGIGPAAVERDSRPRKRTAGRQAEPDEPRAVGAVNLGRGKPALPQRRDAIEKKSQLVCHGRRSGHVGIGKMGEGALQMESGSAPEGIGRRGDLGGHDPQAMHSRINVAVNPHRHAGGFATW